MKKIVLLFVWIFSITAAFAQDYKNSGDAMVAVGNYSGTAEMYKLGAMNERKLFFKLTFGSSDVKKLTILRMKIRAENQHTKTLVKK